MSDRAYYPKGEARRAEILDKTLDAFSTLGYHGSSLREIARELDMTSGHLHYYFATKEELLAAVIEAWDVRNGGRDYSIDKLISSVERNTRYPGLIRLYSTLVAESARPEHPSRSFVGQRFESLVVHLSADIAHQQGEGFLDRSLDPQLTARCLVAASDGLQVQWLHGQQFNMTAHLVYVANCLGLKINGPLLQH
ncbi:TetR/AcrR family transcriptional regulator [Kineococcus rhizosphaerae]|uniref:TetR/AcrR family transcriptional regulator n=1 Tax=Kineococcus rhizosphaerae TaxID=559628 RepID=UPI000D04C3C1|nr:TetR/AcrR family transcriptional regulator [Kineococcus rhizosphaerae]